MKSILLAIFLTLTMCASACAWDMVSAPSPQNATHWRIQLDNGTEYTGQTVNGTLKWNVDGLPAGEHSGQAYFGQAMWTLEAENSTESKGLAWSNGTPFTLIRHIEPDTPSQINIQE